MARVRPITNDVKLSLSVFGPEPDANVPRCKMSEPQGSLITLMRFLEGHLSTSESAAARRRLDAPSWQSVWERLQLAAAETTLPVTTWEEPTVPAETLAAFLEGNLSLDEAARIEQHCWESPELLREMVSTYRYLHVEAPREEATASLTSDIATDRLLAIFPETGSPPTTPDARTSTRPEIATGTQPANAHEAVTTVQPGPSFPVVVNAGKRTKRVRRRSTPAWVVYAATIVIGLGLGLAAVVMISLSRNKTVNSPEGIVSLSEGQDPSAPAEDSWDPSLRPEAPDEGPRPNSPKTEQPQLPNRPFDVANDGRPLPDDSDSRRHPPQRPSPTAANNSPPETQYRPLAVQWDLINGLLVARNDDTQPWHGAHADVHRNAASNYATLPDSWASAKTRHGRIVLAADTQVQLTGSRDSIHMTVKRGRVAISAIPVNHNVRLQTGRKSWIIKPIEEDTAIGFTVFARQSQLVVRRGKVTIAGTEIVAGRQVALGEDALGKPSAIVSSTNWFTHPRKSLKVPAAPRDALLRSRNVRADLATIWRADDHPARMLAARWSLAIAADQTLVQALSAHDDKLRLAALHWLLLSDPDDQRVLSALGTLARQTGNTQMVRNVLSWLRSAQAKRRVTRTDADRMVDGLRSDHLAIRQISTFFLETAFGKRVVFDPKAGGAARQKAVRKWTAFLNHRDHAR